jgi:small subunit ribosomal protein S3Ae
MPGLPSHRSRLLFLCPQSRTIGTVISLSLFCCYLQASQEKLIRKKMVEIMIREAETCDLKDLVAKFIPESIGREIEKACQGIYPLQSTFIRKAKILKAPKFDITKLMEVHQGADLTTAGAVGDRLDRPEGLIAPAEDVGEIEGDY